MEKLPRHPDRFRTYLEMMLSDTTEEVYLVDRDYNIIYCNKNARKNLFNSQDMLNRSLFTAFPGLREENSNIVKVFQTGEPIIDKSTTYVSTDGRRRMSLASIYPIVEDGSVVAVYEISKDITGLSNLSEALMREKIVDRATKPAAPIPAPKKKQAFFTLDDIIGKSESVKTMKRQIRLFAASASNVQIYGETGTGKEMVAQSIFSLGMDPGRAPFVAQNCAAIPENLLESMLFGTMKGAFTGAETRPGLFELASGGMLFLDEVNSMPLPLQAKILRVLEEGRVRRVGGTAETDVFFRLVSSSNMKPELLLQTGELRSDFFYRLNVLSIRIPPLRERREDIPDLLCHYVDRFNETMSKDVLGFDQEALDFLLDYAWPGNVRELKNLVERAMHLTNENLIRMKHLEVLPHGIQKTSAPLFAPSGGRVRLREALREAETKIIKDTLQKCDGNVSRAAREMDIPQQTLDNKIKKYELNRFLESCKLLKNG